MTETSNYFLNGSYLQGPGFPTSNQYSVGLNNPCLSAIDEDTGFISVGSAMNSQMLSDSWKYNFKTGKHIFYKFLTGFRQELGIYRRNPTRFSFHVKVKYLHYLSKLHCSVANAEKCAAN